MDRIITTLRRFHKDEAGVTAIEYGLIAGLVAVAIVGIVGTVGTDLVGTFTRVTNALPQ